MSSEVALPSYFGAALVINLAERVDRRRSVEKEFQKAAWADYRFFPASRFDDAAGFKLPSWRGCFTSHLECLRLAQQQQLENVLIFEDDIALSPSISRLTPAIIATIRKLDWDFLYFGHEMTGNIARATPRTNGVLFERYDGEIMTAHFYAVNSRIIPRLITHFERNARTVPGDHEYGPMLPDGAYNTFRRYNKDVITYLANPKLGWQRPSRSDITPNVLDNYVALRSFMSFGRNVRLLIRNLIH
jgi:GR25 family glycosyltransferase involved in LPS biosynthesis